MKRDYKTYRIALLFLSLTLILTSCSGGGSGGSAPGPPFIAAELDSFPTGSVPPGLMPSGYNSIASVVVLDDNSGAPITDASVTINGAMLTYNFTNQEYEGNIAVSPGESVTLSVTAGGNTYTASGTQFTTYPTVSAPVSGASWPAGIANSVMWSGGTPTTNAQYDLGVLDADNGQLIWPLHGVVQTVPIGTTLYSIPGNSLTAGNRFVIVDIATDVGMPSAAPGSVLFISGFNYIPITVTAPTALASSLKKPWGIAIDSTSVYWTEEDGGVVEKVGVNGGTVTTLASGLGFPAGITVDATNVYWVERSATVNKVGVSGGTVTTLASSPNPWSGIALDSTNIYWTDYTGGTVNKVGINGGTVTTLASGLLWPTGITVDATNVYWVDRSATVKKVGINGGTVISLATTSSPFWGIAVDSNSVYWTDSAGAVYKVGINGGTVTTLASGLNDPWGIAIDSTNVYWTDYIGGTVNKVGINGGTVTTLAAGLSYPTDIKVDATSVYWVEYDTAGSVKKIAK